MTFLFLCAAIGLCAPLRIVSLAPSITKDLYLMGAKGMVIANTIYCPADDGKEKIGTFLEPNIERIIALKPDLVIATKEGNKEASVRQLEKLGISVYVMGSFNSFDDICSEFLKLGERVGKMNEAHAVVAEATARVNKVSRTCASLPRVSVFWEVGSQPLYTVSAKTFVNEFITRAGGTNIFSDLPTRYPQVSREEVVRRDPEAIFVVTMGDVTAGEVKYWQKFTSMKAARTGRISVLADGLFTDPTPIALAEGIERVARILHGDIHQ